MGLLPGDEGSSLREDPGVASTRDQITSGTDPSGFEVVLFSDMGEAKSNRVEELCSQYGVRRETTTGYSPAHNAFVER